MNEPSSAAGRVLVPKPRAVASSDAPPASAIAWGAAAVGAVAAAIGTLGLLALALWAWRDFSARADAKAASESLHALLVRANLAFLSDLPWSASVSAALALLSLAVAFAVLSRKTSARVRSLLVTGYWVALAYTLSWAQDPTHSAYGTWLQGRGWIFALVVLIPVVLPARFSRTALLAGGVALAPALTLLLQTQLEGRRAAVLDSLLAVDGLSLFVAWFLHAALSAQWQETSRAQRQTEIKLLEIEATSARADTWAPGPKHFKHDVVIDVAKVFPLAPAAAAQFESDSKLACKLRSPNTPHMLDFGTSTRGEPYCIRERVTGYDLETLVDKHGPLVPERAIYFLAQIGHAVAEAANWGLIHGDLKPSNVYACERDAEADVVQVLGFGMCTWATEPETAADARQAESATTARGGAASRGAVGRKTGPLSEAAFRAPERVQGKFVPSAAADVYALGCIGYWLLAGRPPFIGDAAALERHHSSTLAPTLSQLSSINPPKDLERILHDCLAKNPGERPDIQQLRKRLLSCNAATHWTVGRARSWWQTHPAPIRAKLSVRDPLRFTLRSLLGDD